MVKRPFSKLHSSAAHELAADVKAEIPAAVN